MKHNNTALFRCTIALLLSAALTACAIPLPEQKQQQSTEAPTAASKTASADKVSVIESTDYFSGSDTKDVSDETPDAVIVLDGNAGTISDESKGSSGAEVTITTKGIYRVTGTSQDVTIAVDDEEETGNIYLILDSVSMTNSADACIRVDACDKLIIVCEGENNLIFTNTNSSQRWTVLSILRMTSPSTVLDHFMFHPLCMASFAMMI